VARATQASDVSNWRDRFESVGKWRLSGSGKYPVNKNAEEFLPGYPCQYGTVVSVIARSDATEQSSFFAWRWIASRSLSSGARSRDPLARNDDLRYAWLATALPIAACAAARRAIGTR
jgi:hypothetical protein